MTLIDNLQAVIHLESGNLPLRMAPLAPAALIESVLLVQQPLAQARGIELMCDLADAPGEIEADADLIGRVLQNLVDNALKFTPSGGQVLVSMQSAETVAVEGEPIPSVRVRVADTGPGIPGDVQSRLFQRFSAGQHEHAGTGLGLAFCKLVVDAHHGHIQVHTDPRSGTVIDVLLPVISL